MFAWKRDIAVLTAGNVKVTMNPRIRLMSPQAHPDSNEPRSSSYNLEIQNVRTNDAGEYACQIGTIIPKEIVHSLEVLGKKHMPSYTSGPKSPHAKHNFTMRFPGFVSATCAYAHVLTNLVCFRIYSAAKD